MALSRYEILAVVLLAFTFVQFYIQKSILTSSPTSNRLSLDEFDEILDARHRRIAKTCYKLTGTDAQLYRTKIAKKHHVDFFGSLEPFRVDEKTKVLWCKVPKAGSTTWGAIFNQIENRSINAETEGYSMWNQIHNALKNDMNFDEVKKIKRHFRKDSYKPTEYRSLLIVRHPFDRMLSSYQEKILDRQRTVLVKDWKGGELTAENFKFSDFLRTIVDEGSLENEHWFPQYGLCDPCNYHFDYVLKLETMSEETQIVLQKLGIADRVTIHHFNKSNKTEQGQNESRSQYYRELFADVDAATLKKLLKIYTLDFKMFNYEIQVFEDMLKEKRNK